MEIIHNFFFFFLSHDFVFIVSRAMVTDNWHLLRAYHYVTYHTNNFTCIVLYHNPMRQMILLPPFADEETEAERV